MGVAGGVAVIRTSLPQRPGMFISLLITRRAGRGRMRRWHLCYGLLRCGLGSFRFRGRSSGRERWGWGGKEGLPPNEAGKEGAGAS